MPDGDVELVRRIAATLRAGGDQAERLRAQLQTPFAFRPARSGDELVAFFRQSPLVGEDLDVERDRSPGRPIDLQTPTVFLLDTNVINELMRPKPHAGVIGWVRRQRPPELFLSAVTLGELVRGVVRLPVGQRRRRLEAWMSELLPRQFEGRILAFDQRVAVIWGELLGTADRAGRPHAAVDAQIAATARRHALVLATRNTRDFQEMNVALLDPWHPPQP